MSSTPATPPGDTNTPPEQPQLVRRFTLLPATALNSHAWPLNQRMTLATSGSRSLCAFRYAAARISATITPFQVTPRCRT